MLDIKAPAECREQAYRLLARNSPVRVMIDIDLRPGTWYIVRAPESWEEKPRTAPEPMSEIA